MSIVSLKRSPGVDLPRLQTPHFPAPTWAHGPGDRAGVVAHSGRVSLAGAGFASQISP